MKFKKQYLKLFFGVVTIAVTIFFSCATTSTLTVLPDFESISVEPDSLIFSSPNTIIEKDIKSEFSVEIIGSDSVTIQDYDKESGILFLQSKNSAIKTFYIVSANDQKVLNKWHVNKTINVISTTDSTILLATDTAPKGAFGKTFYVFDRAQNAISDTVFLSGHFDDIGDVMLRYQSATSNIAVLKKEDLVPICTHQIQSLDKKPSMTSGECWIQDGQVFVCSNGLMNVNWKDNSSWYSSEITESTSHAKQVALGLANVLLAVTTGYYTTATADADLSTGYLSNPAILNDRVIFSCKDHLTCFASETGNVLWQHEIPNQRAGLSSVLALDDIVVHTGYGLVYKNASLRDSPIAFVEGINPEDGKVLWEIPLDKDATPKLTLSYKNKFLLYADETLYVIDKSGQIETLKENILINELGAKGDMLLATDKSKIYAWNLDDNHLKWSKSLSSTELSKTNETNSSVRGGLRGGSSIGEISSTSTQSSENSYHILSPVEALSAKDIHNPAKLYGSSYISISNSLRNIEYNNKLHQKRFLEDSDGIWLISHKSGNMKLIKLDISSGQTIEEIQLNSVKQKIIRNEKIAIIRDKNEKILVDIFQI